MTPEQVKKAVARIEKMVDPESAHHEEDRIYRAVLGHIARGTPHAQELAKEAIKASKISFPRWYA